MAEIRAKLKSEFNELLLVALGAVPGAWIRGQAENDLVVNVVAATILGLLVGLPLRPRRQLMLGVGFCGALHHLQQLDGGLRRDDREGRLVAGLGIDGLMLGLGAATIGFLIGQKIKPSALARSHLSVQCSQAPRRS